MSPGKLASQACHAAKNVSIIAAKENPELLRLYQGPNFLGTQIILQIKNEELLSNLLQKIKSEGFINSLIIDENHICPPYFDGSPIITALGIGPVTKDQIHHLTKRLERVK